MERSSGILLHISSLPSPYGIGNLGKAAYEFVDFLKQAKQKYWQILPINPPGYGDSPYQAFSTFAGNPYFVDPDQLIAQGLLTQDEADSFTWGSRDDQVDFQAMYRQRKELLRLAFSRFRKTERAEFHAFVEENAHWLPEYALFMAVKAYYNDGPWTQWPEDIRLHQKEAIERYQQLLREDMGYHCFVQYQFQKQWKALIAYAHSQGIKIIGDIPIYVPLDSADVWANPDLFQLDEERQPKVVAGCPPDGFSEDGQYWGNPIYDWDRHAQTGFAWWMGRLKAASASFDVLRIDHFRGIESYWSIPFGSPSAKSGQWVTGPGMKLIDAIHLNFPHTDFIAEDLGFLTPEVLELVENSGFPGMKVLEFAFDPREPSNYLPHNYNENCICYTGTHDNETLIQWVEGVSEESEAYAREYLELEAEADLADAIIQAGMNSKANLFVAQMQDYLRLGGEARMNVPGQLIVENWRWRMVPGAAGAALAANLAALTEKADRN